MIQWNNLDTLASYKELFEVEKVNILYNKKDNRPISVRLSF